MKVQIIQPTRPVPGITFCAAADGVFRIVYPVMAFFYPRRLNPQRLEQALARVLNDFPLFAGKLSRAHGRLGIDHVGRGARLEIVESELSLEELEGMGKAWRTDVLGPRVSTFRILKGTEVMFAARVTLARDGSVVTVSYNHVVGDMQTLLGLLRAWASAYSAQPYEPALAIADREAYLAKVMPRSHATPTIRLASWSEFFRAAFAFLAPRRRLAFELSWEDILVIHAAVSGSKSVTPNDTLCARIFSVLRDIAGATSPANLCLTVDWRKRMGLPQSLPGNLVQLLAHPVNSSTDAAFVAAGLRRQLEQFASNYVDYHPNRRLIDAHPKTSQRARLTSTQYVPGRGDYWVSNWTNFGVYDLKFEDVSPTRFCCLSDVPAWSMIVYELPGQSGLGIRMGLPKQLAHRVEREDVRALFVPELPPAERPLAAVP